MRLTLLTLLTTFFILFTSQFVSIYSQVYTSENIYTQRISNSEFLDKNNYSTFEVLNQNKNGFALASQRITSTIFKVRLFSNEFNLIDSISINSNSPYYNSPYYVNGNNLYLHNVDSNSNVRLIKIDLDNLDTISYPVEKYGYADILKIVVTQNCLFMIVKNITGPMIYTYNLETFITKKHQIELPGLSPNEIRRLDMNIIPETNEVYLFCMGWTTDFTNSTIYFYDTDGFEIDRYLLSTNDKIYYTTCQISYTSAGKYLIYGDYQSGDKTLKNGRYATMVNNGEEEFSEFYEHIELTEFKLLVSKEEFDSYNKELNKKNKSEIKYDYPKRLKTQLAIKVDDKYLLVTDYFTASNLILIDKTGRKLWDKSIKYTQLDHINYENPVIEIAYADNKIYATYLRSDSIYVTVLSTKGVISDTSKYRIHKTTEDIEYLGTSAKLKLLSENYYILYGIDYIKNENAKFLDKKQRYLFVDKIQIK